MASSLEQSILKTLCYFDVVATPLTAEEVFMWLWQAPKGDIVTVENTLTELVASKKLDMKFGFYFLPGREAIVEQRRASVVPSEQKLKRAVRAAKFLRWIPYLRAICVCNSVASETAKPDSDIDFFIIAEKDRLWIVRFFSNLTLRLFGLRTFGTKERDRVCLSCFVDTSQLNIAPWKIPGEDVHLQFWLLQMLPIYDPKHWYEQFVINNSWTKKNLSNAIPSTSVVVTRTVSDGKISKIIKKIGEAFWRGPYGNLIEKQAKELQMLKLPLSVKDKMNKDDKGVIVTDHVVKLHEHDTRAFHQDAWLTKCREVI